MVVGTYDGSLKAEHGTGRNMAPFVEMEWGAEAYALMQRDQAAVRSARACSTRACILNDDPDAHLKNLKPLPAVRRARRQVHRVRLLRAEVPVARPDAVAAPAHRRLARDRARSSAGGHEPQRAATARALRLPRHRHLRRLRPVRHRLPGRHRDRPADQGAARPARGTGRRGASPTSVARPLRRRDRRRARRAWAPPTSLHGVARHRAR